MKKVISLLGAMVLSASLCTPFVSAQDQLIYRYNSVNSSVKQDLINNENLLVQSVGFDVERVSKSSGSTRMVLAHSERIGKALPGSKLPDIGLPVALRMDSDGPLVDLFIELRDASTASSLHQYGFQRITEVNGILLGRVPLPHLEALLSDESVAFVEVAMNRMPFNDRALQDTGVPLLHAGTGISTPYRGSGVVIGVLDTGIDFAHPDFSTAAGTRIRYLLDMKVDGTNREWSKAQIDANPGSVTQRDGNGGGGHGTHVAGTAAGNGRVNANYIGVAPEAELLIVKGVRDDLSDGGFADTDVVTGVQWVFDKAQALGRPAVVNLSLGGNYGPMDGTSLYEQSISNLSGQGRIIVVAAGNNGNNYIHVGGNLTQGNLPYEAVLYTVSDAYNYVEAWYDRGAVARVRLAYYSVNAQDELVFEGITPSVNVGSSIGFSGNRLAPEPIRHNGEIIGYYAIDASVTNDSRNGDGNIQLLITDNDTSVDLSEYIWSVIVIPGTTAGRFDMWFTDGEFAGSAIGFDDSRELVGNTNYTVGTPSTARKVISVGSYVTRSRWTDIDGRSWISQNAVPNEQGSREPVFGDRSEFSSKGPTRDGRYAPYIMAPGEKITSALSSHLTLQSDRETYAQQGGVMRFEVAQGGSYRLTQGTSMASPHVAGVVALMLQAYPELDYDGVVDILTRTARRDSQTRAVPNNEYGYGKVDAYSAVLEAAATNPNDPLDPTDPQTMQVVIKTYDSTAQKRSFVVATNGSTESGFLAGTNDYKDQAKASFITLQSETDILSLDEIRFWVAHRKAGATGNLTLNLYNGNTTNGPTGNPFYSATIPYSSIPALNNGQEPVMVTHALPDAYTPPVESFFISLEFGTYGDNDVDKIGLVTSQQLPGNMVPQVWEKYNNNWTRMSAAWNDLKDNGGIQLFYEAMVTVVNPVSIEVDEFALMPTEITLYANYPNPFNPTTVVSFSLPASGPVRLDVFDATGRKVQTLVNQVMSSGRHQVSIDAASWASGVYLYVLQTPEVTLTRKMLLIR